MSIFFLGAKIGMSQYFNLQGHLIPVTIIQIGPCFVTAKMCSELHGYNAIQIGYYLKTKKQKLTKAELFHLKKNNLESLNYLKEFKCENIDSFTLGQKLELNKLNIGDFINVKGKTIGKGYAGNIKRHGFKRGPMSHGSKHHRLQGSLGSGTSPGRVFPGKKMSGHLGHEFQTLKNLEIVDINVENELIILKGSVPGKFGNILTIEKK